MRRWIRRALSVALCGALSFTIAGCSSSEGVQATSDISESLADASAETTQALLASYDLEYTERDKDASYDEASATQITLADSGVAVEGEGASANGSTVTIDDAGTYVVRGSLSDGQIVVDAQDTDKVQVVFAGVQIAHADGPAFFVKQADKCFLTLAAGTANALSDGENYTLEEGADEPNAALFSKDDLTINGEGSLRVTGAYQHAISSKDDLVITGGSFDIQAAADALRGRDCVKISGGTFTLRSGEDAVKSNNDEEDGRGYISIDGGVFDVIAGDDAFHAETLLRVADGAIDVSSCVEGLEGEVVLISGATTHIVSSDDGINAASSSASAAAAGLESATSAEPPSNSSAAPDSEPFAGGAALEGAGPSDASMPLGDAPNAESIHQGAGADAAEPSAGNANCAVVITGGYTIVDAGGDGVDSNGSFEMTDGVLLVIGPESSDDSFFDYDASATISGGTCLMVGGVGMAQGFSSASQAYIMTSASGQAGQNVAIVDEAGAVLASLTVSRSFTMVAASASAMVEGSSYSVVVGDAPTDANGDGFATSGTTAGLVAAEAKASTESVNAGGGPAGGAGAAGNPGGAGLVGADAPEGSHGEKR